MYKSLISIAFILSLIGCTLALDFENGIEMRPGERTAERLFERGIGQPWVGGNPPSFGSGGFTTFDSPRRVWSWWYDPFFYHRYPCYCEGQHPSYYDGFNYYHPNCDCSPYTYHSGYWWS